MTVELSPLDADAYDSKAAYALNNLQGKNTFGLPLDTKITKEHMVSEGYEEWALQQASIPECRFLLFVIKRAKSFDAIMEGLKSFKLGAEFSRIWGLTDQFQRRTGICSEWNTG
jgi:hypothetical protein